MLASYDVEPVNGEKIHQDQSVHGHRMFEEFARFAQAIHENDHVFVKERLAHSKLVMEVVEKALADAQIVLG